jgi:electron transfer flavoprotein beta subunit
MKILVCVKQVADPQGSVSVDGNRIDYGRHPSWRMNRFDAFTLEEALVIGEAHPGAVVDAVSVGPPRVETTIRRSLDMGAGRGIHIMTGDEGADYPGDIARLIASYAEREHYDLVLCGAMSEDDMNGATGPMIAARLQYSCATAAVSVAIDIRSRTVRAERQIDAVTREVVVLTLPAVVSIQSGINRPRYPSLSHVLRARTQDLILIQDTADSEADTVVLGFGVPSSSRTGLMLTGTEAEKAVKLAGYIRTLGVV